MTPLELKRERLKRGWSQQKLAAQLGLSQSYVAMFENGNRDLTPRLVRRLARLYNLPPTALPLSGSWERKWGRDVAQTLAEQLAALGYPGFAYLQPHRWRRNPAEVLLEALKQKELEARVLEALPWLLVSYWDVDTTWLEKYAKLQNLQNRLGFVVALARRVAEDRFPERAETLGKLEQLLEESRLVKEDTLCKASMTKAEERWLRQNRPPEATHWNLLTDFRAESLRYDA